MAELVPAGPGTVRLEPSRGTTGGVAEDSVPGAVGDDEGAWGPDRVTLSFTLGATCVASATGAGCPNVTGDGGDQPGGGATGPLMGLPTNVSWMASDAGGVGGVGASDLTLVRPTAVWPGRSSSCGPSIETSTSSVLPQ